MKRFLLSIALSAGLVLNASAALAAEQVTLLSVPGMTCSLCPITVSKALRRVPGVKDVSVNLDTKTPRVRFDDEATSVDVLTKATAGAGYPSSPAEEKK
jgi:mercuric ion binding protein